MLLVFAKDEQKYVNVARKIILIQRLNKIIWHFICQVNASRFKIFLLENKTKILSKKIIHISVIFVTLEHKSSHKLYLYK